MSETKMNILDVLLTSKTRLRILKILFEVKEINITRLTKMTELNHKVVRHHIDILKELGIIEEKQIGRIRLVRLNESNPKVQVLKEVFEKLEQLSQESLQEKGNGREIS